MANQGLESTAAASDPTGFHISPPHWLDPCLSFLFLFAELTTLGNILDYEKWLRNLQRKWLIGQLMHETLERFQKKKKKIYISHSQ